MIWRVLQVSMQMPEVVSVALHIRYLYASSLFRFVKDLFVHLHLQARS